ncbi:uncharacterized protein LOC129766573 [Toxorhynchites rutilus septentrionalis]|uniref:uncharacterized protein LOC129766573 n=1 Tax=Toxorhynchites rutilus septentrionalis TaxID=329112 RepID=UPI0024785549|nr:uncharacterized protein LOC129766573 [Toxorhynchites rutilus septentrionalis]
MATKISGSNGNANKRARSARTFTEIAKDYIGLDGEEAFCKIDPTSECKLRQPKLDVGNFIRHFRSQHPELSTEYGLLKEFDSSAKKARLIPKRLVPVDHQLLVEYVIKMIANRNLPISFVDWDETKLLLDRLSEAVGPGISFNGKIAKNHLQAAAGKVKSAIADEMKNKLISIKLDSASRHNRHVLCINAQYCIRDEIVIRTLGILEIKESQTANLLKQKIMNTLTSYGMTLDQVFSMVVDNGANMLAAVRKLKEELVMLSLREDDDSEKNFESNDTLTASL